MGPVDIFWIVVQGILGIEFLLVSRIILLLRSPENYPLPTRQCFQVWRLPFSALVMGCYFIGQSLLIILLCTVWHAYGVQDELLPIGLLDYAIFYLLVIRQVVALERVMVSSYVDQAPKEKAVQAHIKRTLGTGIWFTAFLALAASFALFDVRYLAGIHLSSLSAAGIVGGMLLLSYLLTMLASQIVKAARKGSGAKSDKL